MNFFCLSVVKVNKIVVWDIMGYEGPSVGKTSIQTRQIPGEKVQEIETAKFETRVMNKIGA